MTPDELAHTIQLIVAPVVMLTACALTLNGIMSHYQAVSDRLRALTRERLDLLRGKPDEADDLRSERLAEIAYEAPELLHRHQLLHRALVAVDAAMAVLVLCMLTIDIGLSRQAVAYEVVRVMKLGLTISSPTDRPR